MVIAFYISGHGFGHASRDVEVVNAIARRVPDATFVLRTTVPPWFLQASLRAKASIIDGPTDTGVAQIDGLTIDEEATARRAAAFYRDFDRHVEREAALLSASAASLVVGDVPPIAFAVARRAGIPSVALGNFTWDWIYAGYPDFDALAPGVRRIVGDATGDASLALRLPFHGGFDTVRRIEDVPLITRRATVAAEETRRRLELDSDRPVVLASFGGHGSGVSVADAARDGSFTLVVTDYEVEAPESALRVVTAGELATRGLTYPDLVGAADVVVTKAGYGIVSECIANRTALLYAPRGRFPEQDVLLAEMPKVLRCRSLSSADLRTGRWAQAVRAVLAQPTPPETMPTDGADTAADRILQMCGSTRSVRA